jgi:hypothetical protein
MGIFYARIGYQATENQGFRTAWGGDRNLLLSSPNRYKVSDKEPELYSALQQQGSLAVSLLRYSE